MSLDKDIATYYFDHIDALPEQKQFHFANRLASWTKDERALRLLITYRPIIVPKSLSSYSLQNMFQTLLKILPNEKMNIPAFSSRRQYFQTYRPLFGIVEALFRLQHLLAIYNIDTREQFLTVISETKLRSIEDALYNDRPALATLSTYAINYSYLLHRIVLKSEEGVDIKSIYDLGDKYVPEDKQQLRLLIYLYTHCIIGESHFYQRPIPSTVMPLYRKMLKRLETHISNHYSNCNLDTKLEFLVSCRICDYDTPLFDTIRAECEQSVSPTGTFLIDTHNSFADEQSRKNFDASEHRNVLYIMSSSCQS